jgi:broad specificity phosphatase PhoE
MSKTKLIHLFRHAEAQHNAAARTMDSEESYRHPDHIDARLTADGVGQCVSARCMPEVDMIVSSTLTRAVQTAHLLYPDAVSNKGSMLLTDLARERHIASHVCNHRLNLATLRDFWRHPVIGATDEDPYPQMDSETDEEAHDRAMRLVDMLKTMKGDRIAVFTHATFMFSLFHALDPVNHPFWRIASQDYSRALFYSQCATFELVIPDSQ